MDDQHPAAGSQEGAPKSKAQHCAIDKSATETAEIIGTSTRKVEQARAVLDKAAPEVKAAVVSGDMTINKAYQETRTKASGKIKTPAQEEAFYAERAKEEAAAAQPKQKNSVGLEIAMKAIEVLKQIPANDTMRKAGFAEVSKWIKHNGR
jgi:hypothetical protein